MNTSKKPDYNSGWYEKNQTGLQQYQGDLKKWQLSQQPEIEKDILKDFFNAGYDYRSSLLPEIIEEFGEHSQPDFDGYSFAVDYLNEIQSQPKKEAIEPVILGESVDDRLMLEQKDTLVKKVMFYREQTEKLREYIHDKKIGNSCQGFFDAILEHLQSLHQPEDKEDAKDLIIAGITEGAEQWKAEYDNCRELLDRLVMLKECKDANINMGEYALLKPKAWAAAKQFLEKYQHQ